jgi:hypothetical protein
MNFGGHLMYKDRYDFHKASLGLISRTKKWSDGLPKKVQLAQEIFLAGNMNSYNEEVRASSDYYLKAAL